MSNAETRPSSLLVPFLLVALGLTSVWFAVSGPQSALEGKAAPEVSLKWLANDLNVRSTVDLKGQVVLLDFWASWCGPCKLQSPVIEGVAAAYRDKGLAVIGVATSDEAETASAWVRSKQLTTPTAFDEGQRVAHAFGVESLPTLVLLSREGKVLHVRRGFTDADTIEGWLKAAL